MIEALRNIVGAEHVLTDPHDTAPYLTDWRKRYVGRARAVVRPASTEAVAAVVRVCAQHHVPIVPQGGNTGLVGGATPDASGQAIVLSLGRMQRVRSIDLHNDTLVVEAGCVLQSVQEAAARAGRLFPLSLAAEGSCTIGGNLSTNAGGTQVLRYGNARELCLGLEVVTADGEIWDGLVGLRKNNTGYDLRDVFIGAEGTLGVITAACMKLFAMPRATATAFVAVPTVDAAVALLDLARSHCGPTLTGFELMNALGLALVEKHFAAHRVPLAAPTPYALLVEVSDHEDQAHADALLEAMLAEALEYALATDAIVAQSQAQRTALWALRESISEAQAHEGKNIKHDISVPISRIAPFVRDTDAALQAVCAGVRMVTFGHLGDGNLHYNVSPPVGQTDDVFLAQQPAINRCVHDAVAAVGGSISAEHGIGQLKREENARFKSPLELRMMRALKAALDPHGLMNPGKVL